MAGILGEGACDFGVLISWTSYQRLSHHCVLASLPRASLLHGGRGDLLCLEGKAMAQQ